MKVLGQLEDAQLHNRASDPSQGTDGRIWWNTATKQAKIDNGTIVTNLMANDDKAIFGTNGTPVNNIRFHRAGNARFQFVKGDDGTAEGSISTSLSRLDYAFSMQKVQSAAPESPPTTGVHVYIGFDRKIHRKDEFGTVKRIEEDEFNYIEGGDAEGGTTGWADYADAAGSVPVDGTGGSPTTAISTSDTDPLRDKNSFVITKDAADRQGEGTSYDFAIDRADLNRTLSIRFDYEAGTGFVTGGSSDVRVFVYDVDNATVLSPTSITIPDASGKFDETFDVTNGVNYRLIFHVATTNATAWTLKLDSIIVSPDLLTESPFVDAGVPTGVVQDFAGAEGSIPSGWLICGGQAVSRATFGALFSVIATVYGVGDGSTTFNLPDLRGRVIAGKDNMDGVAATRITNSESGINGTTLGASGGVEAYALTTAELAAHTHDGTTANASNTHVHPMAHTHDVNLIGSAGNPAGSVSIDDSDGVTTSPDQSVQTTGVSTTNTGSNDATHNHTFTTGSKGSNNTHQNVQPTMIMNKIIKT